VALGAVGELDLPAVVVAIEVVGLVGDALARGLDGANGVGGRGGMGGGGAEGEHAGGGQSDRLHAEQARPPR
jgi:hypothetical protein